jgi:hypothetical protein
MIRWGPTLCMFQNIRCQYTRFFNSTSGSLVYQSSNVYNKLKLHCIKLTTIPKHLPVKSTCTTVPGTYQSQVASHMWVQWVRSVVSAFNVTHDNILLCVLHHHTATADSCQLTCTLFKMTNGSARHHHWIYPIHSSTHYDWDCGGNRGGMLQHCACAVTATRTIATIPNMQHSSSTPSHIFNSMQRLGTKHHQLTSFTVTCMCCCCQVQGIKNNKTTARVCTITMRIKTNTGSATALLDVGIGMHGMASMLVVDLKRCVLLPHVAAGSPPPTAFGCRLLQDFLNFSKCFLVHCAQLLEFNHGSAMKLIVTTLDVVHRAFGFYQFAGQRTATDLLSLV